MGTTFRSKAEAQRAIDELEMRAKTRDSSASLHARRHNAPGVETSQRAATGYRAEAERIRKLLPTLPD